MKKIFFTLLVLLAWTTLLSAQGLTREQADAIVKDYIQSEALQAADGILYANSNAPDGEGISITTSNEETVNIKYACWAYCLNENELAQRRYLFVNESNGSLLEIIAHSDVSELGASWMMLPSGLPQLKDNRQSLYPNPVDDWLTIPCNGKSVRVEIYDLKGASLFSGTLSDKDTCRLNVSFLNAGIYMINVDGKTSKIIKK